MSAQIAESPSLESLATPPALELRNVESGYAGATVLRNVSLTVEASSVVALVGPNGAGKSTLLKTASGLVRATQGSVLLDGCDVTDLAPYARVRRGLCHVPEGRGIFRSLTVRENLIMQAEHGGEQEAIEQATSAFPVLGARIHQQAGTMSGGEQQMLAMAQAYVRNPRVILVDEASLGLAPIVVEVIFEFLEEVTKRGAALLIVDQFVTRALQMATAAYVLRRGMIVHSAPAAELMGEDMFHRYLGTE